MFELLAAQGIDVPSRTLLDINFENAILGETMIFDYATSRPFTRVVENPGEVVDHPTMGRCFYFNGTGGFRFAEGQSVPVSGKDVLMTVEFQPEVLTLSGIVYTGMYTSSAVPGFAFVTNNNPRGDTLWLTKTTGYTSRYLSNRSTNRRTVEMKFGANKGTFINIQGSAPPSTGSAAPYTVPDGDTLYIGDIGPIRTSAFIPFKGWVKSIKIENITD